MNTYEIIQNAIGASGFTTDDTAAGYVNPSYWNRQVLAFLEERLVVADKAKVYNDLLGQDGASLAVTVDVAPTAAAAVAETDDVTLSLQDHAQVIFTPTEYAKAFRLSDKEARRSFVDQMGNMSKKIGYSQALARDDAAVTLLQGTTVGNTYVANGLASTIASSSIASSDTLDFLDVVSAAGLIMADKLQPKWIAVGIDGFVQLAKDPQFSYANQAGSTETLREGKVGRIFGLDVFYTTQITASSNVAIAIVGGVDQMGEPCFGIANKLMPEIRTERDELGRYTNIVGVSEFDIKLLRADGFCRLRHYAA